jgi:hypothetical protein
MGDPIANFVICLVSGGRASSGESGDQNLHQQSPGAKAAVQLRSYLAATLSTAARIAA